MVCGYNEEVLSLGMELPTIGDLKEKSMGLDTFASRSSEDILLTDEDIQAFKDADISLCGGLLSGGGGSFRGKVYASLIVSDYQ